MRFVASPKYNTSVVQQVKNYLWHLPKAVLLTWINGFPARRLTLIGITGTKGKTSTAHMVYQILCSNGYQAGLVSSIGAQFPTGFVDTGWHVTSPDPSLLQPLLRRALNAGLTHMVLEVTSNALDQYRYWGLHFSVVAVTNIAPDHLDYHRSLFQYVKAKSRLVGCSRVAVINQEKPYFDWLTPANSGKTTVIPFNPEPTSLVTSNQKMAIAIVQALGLSRRQALAGLRDFHGVAGRLETVYNQEFRVMVDFAHTPGSLSAALAEIRPLVGQPGRLIAVFGGAGERDPGRRKMGAVAAKLADYFIVTSEDPRSESPQRIASQILFSAKSAGAKPSQYEVVLDRQQAIDRAIAMAGKGDVVSLFGKGHEASMCFGKVETPWSEYQAVASALKKRKLS